MSPTCSRYAADPFLRDFFRDVEKDPKPGQLAYARIPKKQAPTSFVDNEVEDAFHSTRSLESMYDGIADEDLRSAVKYNDRTAMIRRCDQDYGPTNGASHKAALKAANQSPIDVAKQAIKLKAAGITGQKRKLDAALLDDDIAAFKQDLEYLDTSKMHVDLTCGQVRSLINKVVDNGIMKKGEFCDAIGNSNAGVNAFLKKRGSMGGDTSKVYVNAWDWFKKRDIAGLKMPKVNVNAKKRKTALAEPTSPPI